MKYDILMVGAGLFSATCCALLKDKYKILVIDTRDHIAGNCYDYKSNGTLIHKYGPHIFHSPCPRIVNFLSDYTEWKDFKYSVDAQIKIKGEIKEVPFPYSRQTEKIIGILSEEEVIDLFFKGYSEKMWGVPFASLPGLIRNRVPKDTDGISDYFPGQFQALPLLGYTHMIENMFDGVDIILGSENDTWREYEKYCSTVFYCGRPDHLINTHTLGFRSLKIEIGDFNFSVNKCAKNICHSDLNFTRLVKYSNMTGGKSSLISKETPYQASFYETSPFYPIQTESNLSSFELIKQEVAIKYPKIKLCGRLGTYKYLDMYQVVGQAISFCKGYMQ